jgi:alpha-mannosidase
MKKNFGLVNLIWVTMMCLLAGSLFFKGRNERATAAGETPTPTVFPKRIYIANDDHDDYMWEANQATYEQAWVEMLDYYLNLADSTAGNAPAYQSRFVADGSLWMRAYQTQKTSAAFERLISRIRDGHITIPRNLTGLIYGGMPAEAVLRSMYYSGQIERQYNVTFPLVMANENQTQPYGLGMLWAGAGGKYSWKGVCNCATKVPGLSGGARPYEIYWWTGPDGSRILLKWNSFVTSQSMGGYAEAYFPGPIVEYMDNDGVFRSRYPYFITGAFGKGWDNLKTFTNEFVTTAINETTSSRQVIVSNEIDFFQDFEAAYGSNLPSYNASFGNEWELYQASMVERTGQVKRSVEKLRNAEALAALVSLQNPTFMDSRKADGEQAWVDLGSYFIHNWTADGPVSKTTVSNWLKQRASAFGSYVDTLQTDASSALGGMIQKSGTNPRYYAFNALSWARSDIAEIPYEGSPVHVIEVVTGQETPSQVVTVSGVQKLRFLAKDIPAVGYMVYEIVPGAGGSFSDAATVTDSGGKKIIENDFYKVTVAANGAITSLIDKTRGNKDFARTISGKTINDLGSSTGTLAVENAGPVSVTILATASAPLSHTTRITLFKHSNRIEISNQITQNFSGSYTWAFGFNLDTPDTWHEEVGAVIRAKLLANGGQYAASLARHDWLTLNHFVDMTGSDGTGVTLSNADLQFFQLGNSTVNSLDTTTPQVSVLAGGQVDGTALGILDQGGDSQFLQRFALQTHSAYDQTAAMKFALEHQNPLVTAQVTGGSLYPEASFSLLSIDNPNILLWALKPAEDGISTGLIARVWNLSSNAGSMALTYAPGAITSANRTTHIEIPIEDAVISNGRLISSINGSQMLTFALKVLAGTNPTPTATSTATQTPTPTSTPTSTGTMTPTPTSTSTPTSTPTSTRTPTSTPTSTRTPTSTPTSTRTSTFTPTSTRSPTFTQTGTSTSTETPTSSPTPTRTRTVTPTLSVTVHHLLFLPLCVHPAKP